ncbi:hypothetical protein AAWM_11220 [Aspergillus awamori]|uniref:Uncharacterized protein n=1 Tax=Aspergillus awamori TaxID=105351 RepID=A0A401LA49_ASPAW|nr:hypothetical protein AAWM_11220 [Aspergillus awamori]
MPGVPVVAGVSEVRGPFSVPGTDGVCGSLAAGQPSFTDSRGEPPRGAAVRRRVRGVWTLHPRAVCRSLPAPARAIPGRVYLRADRFLGGYSGGNWMVICVLPVRRGCRCGRALRVPFQSEAYVTRCLFGGFGVRFAVRISGCAPGHTLQN